MAGLCIQCTSIESGQAKPPAKQPGLRAFQLGLRISQLGPRASQSGLRASKSGLRASQPGLRVSQPNLWASQPGRGDRRTYGRTENLPFLQDFALNISLEMTIFSINRKDLDMVSNIVICVVSTYRSLLSRLGNIHGFNVRDS